MTTTKKIIHLLIWSFLFFIAAAAITGLKVFYPFHFLFAVVSLYISIRIFIHSLLLNKHKVTQAKWFLKSKKFCSKHKMLLTVILLVLFAVYVISTVIPHSGNPFAQIPVEERHDLIENDVQIATVLLDNLELAAQDFLSSPLLDKQELTAEENEELKAKWNLFLSVAIESEKVTEVHKYFMYINPLSNPADHAESFIISYTLYIKKFEIFHRIIQKVGANTVVMKQLNEYSPVFGNKNSFDDVLDRFFHSDTFIRRNIGRTYLALVNIFLPNKILNEGYFVLEGEAVKSYQYLFNNVLDTGVNAVKEKRYRLEKDLTEAWFPTQRNIANIMGESYVSSRHDKFITVEQIKELKIKLQPGDILIERRNWYASNVGIPGFWAHAALYTGTIEDMNAQFAELFPVRGFNSVEELLAKEHPKLYEEFKKKDINNYAHAVIEGKSPGIILQSLEESAHADYLAALRPRLSKEDTFKSLLRAFESYGKPYDYNFDFETRDELVCSELIYDAYQPIGEKKGLSFTHSFTSGRKIVSPNDMVKKFVDERNSPNQELDLVYFLDGNEKEGKAIVKGETDFLTTWERPKYSWYQE